MFRSYWYEIVLFKKSVHAHDTIYLCILWQESLSPFSFLQFLGFICFDRLECFRQLFKWWIRMCLTFSFMLCQKPWHVGGIFPWQSELRNKFVKVINCFISNITHNRTVVATGMAAQLWTAAATLAILEAAVVSSATLSTLTATLGQNHMCQYVTEKWKQYIVT